MRRLAHDTLPVQKHALVGEVFSDFTAGVRVMTSDGYPGRITAVLDGPFSNTESYEVVLDGGIGGGEYTSGQLRPLASHTAAETTDDGMSAEAATLHLAAEDYPELSDILHDRLPNERVKVYASRRTALTTDMPGQSSTPESGQMQKKDQAAEQLERAIPQVEQVEPPDACSFCGHDQFENPTNTGRGTRMECAQCGGTMTSWGGQWQPDPPSSPENAASRQGDPRATINDLSAVHSSIEPARGREFIDHFAMREQPAYDPDLGFHMVATWADVRRKAKAIKDSGGVRILAATGAGVVGEVQGEHHLYEASYNYVPGTRKVADWGCGCKWGAYAWGRSPAYKHFEGRQCFLPGTEVSLADGTRKPIELVQPGDRVLTHDGVGTVLNRWDNHYRGEIVGISRAGSPDVVWATADHGMVANTAPRAFLKDLSSTRTYRNRKALNDKSLWGKTTAGGLIPGDWLMGTYAAEYSDSLRQWDVADLSPFLAKQATGIEYIHVTAGGNNSVRTYRRGAVPLNLATPDFAALLGWYLAEGNIAQFDRNDAPCMVEWTLHRDEIEYGDEIRALIRSLGCGEPRTYNSSSARSQTIKISNSALALVLSHLAGTHASSKQLHPMVMTASVEFQRALLESYLKGDGCESAAGTASHALAKQIVTLGARTSAYVPRMAMQINNRGPQNRSKGAEFYSVETAGVFMQGRELLHDNYYAVRVNKVQRRQYHGPVYNLNVDYQHTYAVDDLVVFNCSHVTALQYEAQSRGMFGRQVSEDAQRLPGQHQRSPVTVQYDRAGDANLNRRTVPPGNMRRTFSVLDSAPEALDLAPVHAFACEMIRAKDDPDAILTMLAKHGVAQETALQITAWAASVVGDADGGSTQPGQDIPGLTTRDTTELKKKPHHHDHHTNDSRAHAPEFGRGIGWYAPGLMWCDQCNGSGCGHCGGTGQVMSGVAPTGGPGVGDLSTTTSPVGDESASAGEDSSGGVSATSSLQLHQALLQQFTADYAVDSFGGGNPAQTYQAPTQHSNSVNPASTGWATSADPQGWIRPLINNNYGLSASAAERGASDICGGCGEHIHATGDHVAPWVHSHTGNSFCDVHSTNDAALLAGSPLNRPEAEPIMHEASVEGQPSLPEYTHAGLALKAADTGRVLMIQRSIKDDNDPAKGTWEFPGGGKEPGDKSSVHTGVREWEEEVGHPFPEGGHVSHTWRSGTYHGHVVTIPAESQIQFAAGRSTVNPDDPGGDDHEQSAWWHPADAKKNPALREELKKNNPFGDIAKAAKLPPPRPVRVPLTDLITDRSAMEDVMRSGRRSETPDEPIYLSPREDMPGKYEIGDGHHRVNEAIQRGETHINGEASSLSDDEPYEGPFYDFSKHMEPNRKQASGRSVTTAELHDQPESALPSTDGGVEDDPVPEAGVMSWAPGDPAPGQYLAAQPEVPWGYEGGPSPAPLSSEASFDDVPLSELVAAFQATAAGQKLVAEAQGVETSEGAQNENAQIAAMARAVLAGEDEIGENGISKSAMKEFSFAEQQELISEGANDGTRARNFDGLQIEGTHYALLGEGAPEEELWL